MNYTNPKKTILIIEDEIHIQKVLADNLLQENFSIYTANDGKRGLEMALQEKPDLILLDLVMPNMNGITFLQALRKHPWGKKVKVIILTNVNEAETIEKAVGKGVFDYFVKANCKMEDVIKAVKLKLS